MDKVKIGRFIAQMRKDNGLTQQELADLVGVTNKAVSKWECGNGLPEMENIGVLCDKLGVSVNELLSGERIEPEKYLQKAESNILNLIEENEKQSNKGSVFMLVMMVISSIVGVGCVVALNMGGYNSNLLVNLPAILIMIIISVMFLVATGIFKDFFKAFAIVCNKSKVTEKWQIKRSVLAVELVRNTWLITGVLMSVQGYISILFLIGNSGNGLTFNVMNIAVATLGILYGIIGYLVLLPIKIRVEVMEKEND